MFVVSQQTPQSSLQREDLYGVELDSYNVELDSPYRLSLRRAYIPPRWLVSKMDPNRLSFNEREREKEKNLMIAMLICSLK